MQNKKIHFVIIEDWEGVYVNGKLVLEDHSLEPLQLLDALGISYTWEQHDNNDFDLPENLEDFVSKPGYGKKD